MAKNLCLMTEVTLTRELHRARNAHNYTRIALIQTEQARRYHACVAAKVWRRRQIADARATIRPYEGLAWRWHARMSCQGVSARW
jgi:hypothetical protein